MIEYRYRALRGDGVVESGALRAEGREDASSRLAARGLFPVAIQSVEPSSRHVRPLPWSDLALGLRVLANLLQAGLPLDRALAALAESAPHAWRRILPDVAERVRQGATLGAALAGDGSGIPALVTALVQAGEAAGSGAGAVERAAGVAETVATTRAAIRQALVYPAILLAAGLVSLGFLTGYVLPRFAAIIAELGQSPPVTTRIVLAAAELGRSAAGPSLALGALGFVLWRAWTRTAGGRHRWHLILRRAPLIGRARFSLASARAANAVGALLESGVPLARALLHGADAGGDESVTRALRLAREAIVQGESPSRALAREEALTPTALRLVRVGEETGRLGSMLIEAGRLEQASAERLVRGAVQLIEPAFIVAFGGLVALVASALLQALYGVRPG